MLGIFKQVLWKVAEKGPLSYDKQCGDFARDCQQVRYSHWILRPRCPILRWDTVLKNQARCEGSDHPLKQRSRVWLRLPSFLGLRNTALRWLWAVRRYLCPLRGRASSGFRGDDSRPEIRSVVIPPKTLFFKWLDDECQAVRVHSIVKEAIITIQKGLLRISHFDHTLN